MEETLYELTLSAASRRMLLSSVEEPARTATMATKTRTSENETYTPCRGTGTATPSCIPGCVQERVRAHAAEE